MNDYVLWKWLHIVSSTMLFGAGIGTALHFLLAMRSRSVTVIAATARQVVLADWLLTTPAIVFQPLSGIHLAHLAGFAMDARWITWSLVLFGLATACWLPVVWLQLRMRDLAGRCAAEHRPLPAHFHRLFRIWMALGFPALFAFLGIFHLMVSKPA